MVLLQQVHPTTERVSTPIEQSRPVTLEVMEVYQAVQGEGPNIGTPCVFIRLQGCPVHCVWCDISDSWSLKTDESRTMTVDQILDEVNKVSPFTHHIVLTGGEPLMQRKGVIALLSAIREHGFHLEIETSGTFPPVSLHANQRYNVSPKMSSAKAKLTPDVEKLKAYLKLPSVFKFVISDKKDFDDAMVLTETVGIPHPRVYLMPEGVTAEAIIDGQYWLTKAILEEWPLANLTTRLHILTYGNQRKT